MAKLKFLESTRFWAVIVIALAMLLKDYSIISPELFNFLATIAGGHIGIRTIDRGTEKIGSKDTK